MTAYRTGQKLLIRFWYCLLSAVLSNLRPRPAGAFLCPLWTPQHFLLNRKSF
nr:MAG TPA: hypothetical protein [Caudoviricetes sp.]